ncbi:MAG: hypothetical protein IKX30_16575 [Victivallales bacterium]|nr:hypothetical protein [Victivallales bacterium]
MEKLSDETLLTLLEDTDSRSSLAAMQFMLKRGDLDAFVAAHQDEENPRLRRRIQQLHNVARLRHQQAAFIEALDEKSMTFWQAVRRLSLIYDQRYSEMALDQKIEEFLNASRMRQPSSDALARLLNKKNFEPPRYNEMFELETFFLPEALFSGCGQTLLLCALAKQVCQMNNWGGTIVLYSGKFMLQTPDGKILMPEDKWEVLKDRDATRFHICTDQELIHTYLAQIAAACVVDDQPYDLCVFSRMMTTHCGGQVSDLPYPLGTLRQEGDDGFHVGGKGKK